MEKLKTFVVKKSEKQPDSVRSIVVNAENKIALIFSPSLGRHFLPGGKLDSNHKKKECLRETKEEIGAKIKITAALGYIEKKSEKKNKSIKKEFCYVGEVENTGFQELGKSELDFVCKWLDVDEALGLLKKDSSQDYPVQRDIIFLETHKKTRERINNIIPAMKFSSV